MRCPLRALPVVFIAVATCAGAKPPADVLDPLIPVGFSRVDITPQEPIRLAGYGDRTEETSKIGHPLMARALAIGGDPGAGGASGPAVLITVDLVGVTSDVSDNVAKELWERHGIERGRVAVCATHTHTGPMLDSLLTGMFGEELPADQAARIHRYTEALKAKLKEVAEAALADRRPARLAWGQGTLSFATARRLVKDGKWYGFGCDLMGPADRTMPLLRVTDASGRIRGVLLSYACHNTTLRTEHNFFDPDWAGDACRRIESEYADSTAMVALGCAGDTDPEPFGSLELVAKHGLAVATEVDRLLALPLLPLGPVTGARIERTSIPLDHAVTREELEKRLMNKDDTVGRLNASRWLARLNAGQSVDTEVPFTIQYWTFGNSLAMVFFSGEMVSDYSLRLRRELDGRRLWVNAYSNDVPCYVASSRMFPEGGYEVGYSMNFYGWPTQLAPNVEDVIISDVRKLLPDGWARARPLR